MAWLVLVEWVLVCFAHMFALMSWWIYFGPMLSMIIILDISIIPCPKYVLWILWMFDSIVISFWCILWMLNIVWISSFVRNWICAFDSTHNMRNAQIKEEPILYWLSRFFFHFGTCCQWGRSLEGLGEVGWFLSFLLIYFCCACSLHGCVYRGNSTKLFPVHILWGSLLYIVWFY